MADFDPAVEFVLSHEGGYVNNSTDPGGETNFGISQRAFPSLDIKNLTLAQAKSIYQQKYWNPLIEQLNNQDVANKLFDLIVNSGHDGIKVLQMALQTFKWPTLVDGILGTQTITQANHTDATALIVELRAQMCFAYYAIVQARPNQAVFLKGWVRRAVV